MLALKAWQVPLEIESFICSPLSVQVVSKTGGSQFKTTYGTLRSMWKHLPIKLDRSTFQEEREHVHYPSHSQGHSSDFYSKQLLRPRGESRVIDQLNFVSYGESSREQGLG